jgi:hypothetical protein
MMKKEVPVERESPFACVMDAIEPTRRQQHIATAKFVFAAVTEIRELPNGYAFHLPNESGDAAESWRFHCPGAVVLLPSQSKRRGLVYCLRDST